MGLRRDEEQAIAGRGGEVSWDERREVSFDCIDEWMLECQVWLSRAVLLAMVDCT